MAAVTKGNAHWFGVGGSISSATIQSINGSQEAQLDETTEDQNGVTIETRLDNLLKSITVTLRGRTGYTTPNIGTALALSGLNDTRFNDTYEVTGVESVFQHDQFTEVTLSARRYANVTVS